MYGFTNSQRNWSTSAWTQSTNAIESRLLATTTEEDLQRELDSVRLTYQKWQGDQIAMRRQTRLAQIIHAHAKHENYTC